MESKYLRTIAGVVASAALVAACSGSGATTAPAEATPAPATVAPADATPPAGEVPLPDQTTLRIGLSVNETSQYAAKLAEQLGIYQKYGFEKVEVTVFEGDGKTMQALQAGQLDIAFIGVSSAITSQITDAPVKVISVNAQVLSDLLISTKDVTSPDQLKGKCVAVSTYGGTSHGAVILALQALNLTPEDVVITEVGKQDARIAALQGGSCAAAPIDASRRDEMLGLGFNELLDLKKSGTAWGRSGAGVLADWMAANQNTMLAFEAALIEAQNLMWSDPDTAAAKYAEFIEEPDLAKAKALIVDFQSVGNRTMMWTDQTFENPKTVLATVNPDIKDVVVSTAYDMSILLKLKDLGFFEKLGVPLQ